MEEGYRECDCNCNRVNSFSSLTILSTIVMLESRESLRKKSVQKWSKNFIRKASISAPDATVVYICGEWDSCANARVCVCVCVCVSV